MHPESSKYHKNAPKIIKISVKCTQEHQNILKLHPKSSRYHENAPKIIKMSRKCTPNHQNVTENTKEIAKT